MQLDNCVVIRRAFPDYVRIALFGLMIVLGSLIGQPAMAALCSGVFPKDATEESVPKLDLGIMDKTPSSEYRPFPTKGIALDPGDYFYNGDSLKTSSAITLSVPGQKVRIFIEGNTTFQPHSEINKGGSAMDLLIVVNGHLRIGTKNQINALIYVTGNVEANPDVHISGALTAEGTVETKVKDVINYDRIAAEQFSSGDLCTDETVSVDHFRLLFPTPQFSCEPIPVTIRACVDSACSSTLAVTDTLSLTPAGRWLNGGTVAFADTDTATGYLKRIPGTLTLGVAAKNYQCNGGSCELEILRSGFQMNVPDLIAGKPGVVDLQARRLPGDRDDGPCEADRSFASSTRQVAFWSGYVTPDSGTQRVHVNDSPIGTDESSASAVSVVFDAQASSRLQVRYDDAGSMELQAKVEGGGEEEGLEMRGGDQFVSRPYGLCLEADLAPSKVLYQAGEKFGLKIRAKAWTPATDGISLIKEAGQICNNPTIKNYEQVVRLTSPVFEAGSDNSGWPDEDVGKPGVAVSVSIPASAPADAYVEKVSIKEVGVFHIIATPPSYLGSDMSHAVSRSSKVGRFIPANFLLEDPVVAPLCSSFTYAGLVEKSNQIKKGGQPFMVEGMLSARNSEGGVTRNYKGGSAKLLTSGELTYQDSGNFLNEISSAEVYFSQALDSGGNDKDGYIKYVGRPSLQLDSPVGPYSLELMVKARDADGVEGVVLDVVDGGSGSLPEFRLGRARIISAHGSELLELPLPAVVEYFNGNEYVENKLDNCTIFADSTLKISLKGELEDTTEVINDAFPLQAENGRALIKLRQQEPKKAGTVEVSPQLEDEWLKFDWENDTSGLESPTGLATFGIYRGNEKIIFRREVIGR